MSETIRPSRRAILRGLGAAGAQPLAAPLVHAHEAETPCNVVVLCLDQVCARDMPLMNLPNLEQLARDGLSCTASYCASPLCAPTRQSLLTGLYPSEHGVLGNDYVLNAGLRTVVDVFAEAGYTTACFGKLHTNNAIEQSGAGFGFQSIWNTRSPNYASVYATYKDRTAFARFDDANDKPVFDAIAAHCGVQFGASIEHVSQHREHIVTREALGFLDAQAGAAGPFFLMISLQGPHYPYLVPMREADLSTDEWYYNWRAADVAGLERVAGERTDSPGWRMQNDLFNDWRALSADQHQLIVAKYFAYFEYFDYLVGLVLDRLDSLGLSEDTLVVFTADHGEGNGHHGLYLKRTCFEETARVPLVMRAPGRLAAGATYEGLVSAIDVLPTVAGLVGLGAQVAGLSGQDLSGALRGVAGANEREDLLIADYYLSGTLKGSLVNIIDRDRWSSLYYTGTYKSKGYVSAAGYQEVYDLSVDPDMTVNLIGDSASVRRDHTSRRQANYAALRPLQFPLIRL